MSEVRQARAKARGHVSSFALKQVMAVTGVVFVGFVVVHMIGNLKIYWGQEALDHYATWLREVGYPFVPKHGVIWALRAVLAVSLVAHAVAAVTLWARGRRARGPHRRRRMPGLIPNAARAMLPTGTVVLVFVVVHLLDLTIGAVVAPGTFRHAGPDGVIPAYHNVVASFSRPWMALFYILVMVLLAVHLEHGWRTLLQDWGVTGARLRKMWAAVGYLLALAVVIGNALIPALVLMGVFG